MSVGFRCVRWEKAMRTCIGADMKQPKRGRWKGDPIALSDEAFSMTKENQNAALDYMEDAPPQLRDALAPLWKYGFAQWIIYDAGQEADRDNKSLAELLSSQEIMDDVESLKTFVANGGMDKVKKTEKWTWRLLDPLPKAGSSEGSDNSAAVMQAAREERTEGCEYFKEGVWHRAFWHFSQGIRQLAKLPEPLTPLQAKIGCDLFKNIAAAATKLNMNRIALNVSDSAIGLSPQDQKAWFRRACALQNLDRDEEATEAFMYAGYVESEKDLGVRVDPPLDGETGGKQIEKLSFLECGIDSIDAVELIAILQDNIEGEIPRHLLFTCPTVGDAVKFLAREADAPTREAQEQLEYIILQKVYKAMCTVLNRDPLKIPVPNQMLTEEKALGALLTLLENYEDPAYVEKCERLAKRVDKEYKPFLQSLRRHALERQVQSLEIRGFDATFEGMRRMECALIVAAKESNQVNALLQKVRVAAYGGPNGMWPHVMGSS